jgi:NAD+ synthase (glutamine-hydrolysing)
MRIGLGQINSTIGDFAGNRQKIVDYSRRAREKHCDLIVFPELALMGYMPNDLLERDSVVKLQLKEFALLQKEVPEGIALLVGLVTLNKSKRGKPYCNSAALIQKGKKPKFFHKELLPAYDIFDETRHLEPGKLKNNFFTFKGKRILVTICEDIWAWGVPGYPSFHPCNPLSELPRKSVDLVVNLSASPFTQQKSSLRKKVVAKTSKHFNAPMVYVNMVGAQDETIFDGGSFAVGSSGKVLAQNLFFEEDLNILDLKIEKGWIRDSSSDSLENCRQAIILGIRDFVRKTGFSKVHLGLSGGIDSAVVACLAVDALGPGKVTCVTLPSMFSSPISRELADRLAKNLHVRLLDTPITATYEVALKSLQDCLGEFEFGVVQENLQSRIRGMLLMAIANKENSLLLTTGNKSELATGYATLYGDMCGGLAPIADLVKSEVYDLARIYNKEVELIPNEIITRAPSAELRPGQKDQDTLPPYDDLDLSVKNLVERGKPARSNTDKWLIEMLMKTEFKRWQAAPILKLTSHAFGRGRRLPIANKAKV